MVKVKELPIYETCCMKIQKEDKVCPEGYLEPYIRDVRKEACNALTPIFGDYLKQTREQFNNAVDLTKESVVFVRQEENIAARAAFITASTFLGVMVARRGFFKRIIYASIGGGSSAAICNPQMARDYVDVGTTLARQTANDFYQQNKESLSIDNLKKLFDSK